MQGSQTESEQQKWLFAMLEQKNGEIKHFLGEIKNLEKFKTLYESMESKPSTSASPCSLEGNTYYADLFQLKLDKLKKTKAQKASYPHREWRRWEPVGPGYWAETVCEWKTPAAFRKWKYKTES